jgi:exonuclease SbcC
MRLHRLELRAFGPFAGEERVDFDHLTSAGLFLLCGPTGAGKTSLLDAVCFALFGQVPGERDKAKRLHSDHAPADQGPRVVLEATIRGRRLRITRCPEWMRPKKRGSGEIKEHAKVLVEERVDGQWQQRTSRIDEAGDLLGSLLGLTLSQFCQVALLPQGRFETFLRCGAQERHALLEKLFGTHRFRVVEEWLGDHRRDLAARSAGHAVGVTGVLERVAEVCGCERPDGLGPEGAAAWVDGLRRHTADGLAEAVQARGVADLAAKDARTRLEEAQDLARLQARHREARRRDGELRALADNTAHERRRLERAALAAGVSPLLDLHDAAVRRVRRARHDLDAARAAVPSVADAWAEPSGVLDDADVADVGAGVDAVAGAVRRCHDEVTRLKALLPDEARLRDIDAEVERLERQTAEAASALERLDEDGEARTQVDATLREAHAAALSSRARLEPLQERLTHAEHVARAAARLPGARRRRDTLADAKERVTDEAQRARDAWLDLRQARIDGMAAELARDLTDGAPCPVCGSAAHPSPASARPSPVSPEAEEQAERTWHELEHRRQEAAEALTEAERELAALASGSEGLDPEPAEARVRAARVELRAARASAAEVESLAASLEQSAQAARAAVQRRQELEGERGRLAERARLRAQEGAGLRQRIDAATGGEGTLLDRLAGARAAASAFEHLLDCLREHTAAARARDEASARLRTAVLEAGFTDEADARSACLSPTERSNIEALLRARDDQAAQVRAVLEDPRIGEAAATPGVDLRPFEEGLAEAERVRDAAVGRERELDHRARRLEALHTELAAALAAWEPVRAELALAERLASLCAGTSADNRHKMRLSAYVLAARLEQVVAAANERLLQMSSGRYTLQHTVARGVGDRRGGLGLQVHDGWTGDVRDPATLSGGETFFTSLALALGLADVVSHEAGGTEIDTLFVDEGFGSLDPEALDLALSVLTDLRQGGRLVGIVSHVQELKERVDVRLEVTRTERGSSARFVLP